MVVICRGCHGQFDSLEDFDAHECPGTDVLPPSPPPPEPSDAMLWPRR